MASARLGNFCFYASLGARWTFLSWHGIEIELLSGHVLARLIVHNPWLALGELFNLQQGARKVDQVSFGKLYLHTESGDRQIHLGRIQDQGSVFTQCIKRRQ